MANDTSTASLRHLSTLFSSGTPSGLSDTQLLDRIRAATRAASTAEAAFEALMARHGPMVLGVCRRALNDPRDVEDAFQATFLVLVRKSGVVRVDDSLGRWLYGVARRVAHRARTLAEKRRTRETASSTTWEPAFPAPDAERAELLAALDDELGRLPEKYRVPVLLCDLEGLTHTEAANRLQWPVGTVKGRLAQARNLLRGRLARRGLAPAALFLGSALKADARLVVPAHLAERTVRSALPFAVGGQTAATLASASVVALSRGALRAMLFTKLKFVAIGLLAALGMTAGVGILAQAGHGDEAERSNRRIETGPASDLPGRTAEDQRPANAVAIVSDVESDAKIILLAPNGSTVRRGDVVCRLDSANLKDQLAKQVIATLRAEAAYQKARRQRETAEIAVAEYKDGIYKQELQTLEGEISLAEAERERAEDRLGWSQRMRAKGYLSKDRNVADKIALDQKIFAYEQAMGKKNLLETYTSIMTIKELQSEVEQARAEERIRELDWRREKDKRAKIENQIAHCRIVTPVTGRLDYARWPIPGVDGQFATVEKGMTVRWAQLLFWVLPSDRGTDRSR
ncbi:sigma-70 family RNA polymerase sigma factor [Singulisphaera acidiphila]|uniref:RNA polymerase sigma factor, sigma-70 family n=1 Tax=Singulisphaera acidiphila (strain ATCC BAA-1392 / DSM 18658 / VKM B-2454 / MOB10) TaxID=886293 RepID=L0DIU5_SINAD|nr:sigma-70 family RNA polymerase sigma factor [Singulisphaera acidiphila]AGA28770.1 RNA polymerase sigma factor, sigma-70 family [Singulisphaera acidiphila DSM 18658]